MGWQIRWSKADYGPRNRRSRSESSNVIISFFDDFFQKTGSIKTQSHLTKFKNIHYILILYVFPLPIT